MARHPDSTPPNGNRLPLLPMKDIVLFPGMVVPLMVGRPRSLVAVEESVATGRPIFLCTQRDASADEPQREQLYDIGVRADVLQTLRGPDGALKVVVEANERARIRRFIAGPEFDEVQIALLDEGPPDPVPDNLKALARTALGHFENYVRLSQRISPEILVPLRSLDNPTHVANAICAHFSLKPEERQALLELPATGDCLERVCELLLREIDLMQIEQRTNERFRQQNEQGQRERYLQEQLRVIQQELGAKEGSEEINDLRARIEAAGMPKEVRDRALREVTRYERMPPLSPESAMTQAYIEWLVDVPWSARTKDKLDLAHAQKVLDEDHYGLPKVKDRILEFLAVRKLSKSTRGPVLCLVGPPGVGKTSLGKSVARAMDRKFVRISLGGIRDEAEIRGHRRTYIGALPGRILQSMKRAGVVNPVFMLDEVDKLNADFRGDPASALLEVLDPEQNRAFSDHYLEVDYDLHEVFFITTANNEYEIPEALLDRMEVVRIPGYTPFEKKSIAELFLIPRQIKESGLAEKHAAFLPEAIDTLITRYTREAGVRELDRQIANVCRKIAREVVSKRGKGAKRKPLTSDDIFTLLGPAPQLETHPLTSTEPGVGIGLAWTPDGGDTLTIETTLTRGKGELKLTGHLGEVMQESAQAAYTFLRANATRFGVKGDFWKTNDVHIHVPEGAIPKDGPSAGSAITISILSALLQRPAKPGVAVTGEITLRGRILPVGGVKEKILAAHRAKLTRVLLPQANEKDLVDIPAEVKSELEIVLVNTLDDVLRLALGAGPARKRSR
jgi:ATP-dependent Lon protease